MVRLSGLRCNPRGSRAERRARLTRGERALGMSLALLPSSLAVAGIVLLLSTHGATRGGGFGLLIVSLVLMTVPISPLLGAKVRRREARDRSPEDRSSLR